MPAPPPLSDDDDTPLWLSRWPFREPPLPPPEDDPE